MLFKLKYPLFLFALFQFIIGHSTYAQAPVANFSADAVSGCSPLKVNFSDASSGNPTAWLWDLGNGAISTKKDPSGFYIQPGNYTVKLTVSNASGSSSKTGTITVYENPKPAFIADKNIGCTPIKIQFTDQSDPGAGSTNVSWLWDLGNGAQSTQQNPVVKYNSTGMFTVVLKVTNNKGCSSVLTQNRFIVVNPGINIGFTASDVASCDAPFAITFNNVTTGSGNLQYLWRFGDGNQSSDTNAINTFATAGVYPVTLIAYNNAGCADTLTKQITLAKANTDFVVADTLCVGSPATFTNKSTPAVISALWTFSDGSTSTEKNAVKTFAKAGTYTVTLTNTYSACVQTVQKTVTVTESPVAAFKASALTKCNPDFTVAFENLSQNAVKYVWNFGDGSPLYASTGNASHTYTKNGKFTVSLTAYNSAGCSHTYVSDKPIVIDPPAVKLDGIPERGCLPFAISPVATINSVSNIASYKWEFGDGNVRTEAAPNYTYTAPGNYIVKLTITTVDGCTSSATMPIRLGNPSKPAFSAAPRNVCAIDSVFFTNASEPKDATFTWNFGDGGQSTSFSPTYTYNDTGWFQIKLVSDNNGCRDSVYSDLRYIYIKAPIARFNYKPVCNVAYQYQFTDASLFDKESEGHRTWQWVFPDGSVSNNATPPLYTFPGPGEYKIVLTISNGNCIHKTTRMVTIADKVPDFIFNKDKNCKPVSVAFKAVTSPAQNVVAYRWQLNGFDTTTRNAELNYLFNTSGAYEVTLTTTDDAGCVNTIKKPIVISGPKADFLRTHIADCKKMTATFKDSSQSFGASNIVNWQWDFGDGLQVQKSDTATLSHVYEKGGVYKVKLTITDATGCTDTAVYPDSIRIIEMHPDWTASDKACLGFPIAYQNKSTGDYTSFVWNFGDGSVPVTTNTGNYVYKDTGLYDVKLTIQDVMGCKDSLERKQYVHIAKPVAAFSVKDSISFCPPFDVNFTNTSQFFNAVEWKIGDEKSNEIDHRKLFTQPGTFDVYLKVVSPDGNCTDVTKHTILLHKPEDAKLTYDPLKACIPGTVNLQAFDDLASAKFYWDFGDGNILDTSASKTMHVYNDLGNFIPKIILTEASGCVITIAGVDTIKIKGAKTKFDVRNRLFCDSGYVQLLDSTLYNDPIVQYTWNFGDGYISNQQHPKHQYLLPGTYNISLAVKTEAGCEDSTRLSTPVKMALSPQFKINGDSVVCINGSLTDYAILQRPDSNVRWSWSFPNGNASNLQTPSVQQYTKAGNFQIKTIATNSSGCADTVVKNIFVNPIPVVNMPALLTTPVGNSVTIPATFSSNILNYTWWPNTTLSCNNCPQPIASPKFTTTYDVHVVDSNGCRNRGEIKIVVLCQGITVFLPNTFSPNGDGSNDVFYVRGKGLDRVKLLRVFNRWGEVVFEQKDFGVNDPSHGWNGMYKGIRPKPDVYVYQLELYCSNGELLTYAGNVTLLQ